MKQSKFTKAMALMLSLVMITSVFVGNTLSRYVTSVSSTDNARVAVWGINGEEVTMELFNTEYDLGGKLIAKSNVNGEKIIAPGTGGQSAFSIINFESDTIPPEVAYDVKISLDDSKVDPKIINNSSIQWKLDNNSWGTFDELKTSLLSLVGDPSGLKTYAPGTFADAFKGDVEHKIYWQWVMDGNNEVDTQMGNDALTSDIGVKITVSITAEQSDGSSVNMLDGVNQVINLYNVEPAVFRSVAPMEDLLNVTVNDEIVDPSNYDVASGSTIITFHKDYLETLEEGTYTININSKNDITATAKFYVVEKYSPIEHSNIIPEGGTYYKNTRSQYYEPSDIDIYYVGDFVGATKYEAGQEFPELERGDVYVYGDYEYRYGMYSVMVDCYEEGWDFKLNNEWGVRYIGNNDKAGKILTSINGADIKNLDYTFARTSIKIAPLIPDTITSMYYTFSNCSNLKEAPPEIPDGVTELDNTFAFCQSLLNAPKLNEGLVIMNNTFWECNSLTKAPIIPSTVIDMKGAFNTCLSLEEAPVIPNGVKYMNDTFGNCFSLKKAPIIPESVLSASGAFYYCISLEEAPVIPSSVDDISYMFEDCTNLTGTIEINANPTKYTNMLKDTQITNIIGSISDELKQAIAENCEITLREPIKIHDGGDTSKTGVYYILGQYDTVPGEYFDIKEKYINGAIPEELVDGLVYVEGDYEYRYNMYFYGPDFYSMSQNGWGVALLDWSKSEYGEIKSSILGKDIVNVDYLFSSCINLEVSPEIPDSVTSMVGTFSGCTSLVNAPVIPDGVTNMYYTFYGCESLVNAPVIPESVEDMSETFHYCSSLMSAPVIPKNVTSLFMSFAGCSNLNGIVIIHANPTDYTEAFGGVGDVILTGTSNILNEIAADSYDDSVTVGQ